MIDAIGLFKQFKKDCAEYAKSTKNQAQSNKMVKKSSYSVM